MPADNPMGESPAEPDWDQFRRLNPVSESWAYFDNAAVAPLPSVARDAILQWLNEAVEDGDTKWPDWTRRFEATRASAAKMIGASTRDVALVSNTTMGITFVAEGFPWKEGDNVVLLANEFPTNQYPWLNLRDRGVEIRRVNVDSSSVDLNWLSEACDSRTKIVSVSWVSFSTGWRFDLDHLVELVHGRGALLVLDAIQGLGVFPIDVSDTPIDFLAADGHKWMLGPEGAGIFYLRHEHLDLLRPIGIGWNSVVGRGDYSRIDWKPRPEAARYEGGTWNTAGFLGLGASLDLLQRFGVGPTHSAIGDRILVLTDHLCQRLQSSGARIVSSRDGVHRSGIVSFDLPGVDLNRFRKTCLEHKVVLSCRNGCLRISPHAYCNDDDIQRLLSIVHQRG